MNIYGGFQFVRRIKSLKAWWSVLLKVASQRIMILGLTPVKFSKDNNLSFLENLHTFYPNFLRNNTKKNF